MQLNCFKERCVKPCGCFLQRHEKACQFSPREIVFGNNLTKHFHLIDFKLLCGTAGKATQELWEGQAWMNASPVHR